MKFHYMGKYSGNEEDLPRRDHEPGAVAFREVEDSKALSKIANAVSIVILVIAFALLFLRTRTFEVSMPGFALYLLSLVPHEYLHALCYHGDVYMYQNLKHGMLFVVSPERMSKGRFIFMSLLPTLVLAVIPYVIFMIHPQFKVLGTLGAAGLASGAGDYYNVYNALTQMPKGAWTYLHGFHSYWYMPQDR
ncbi:MAG: DUF3267 domain-containing protein [Firmicutes bacterium]|nr:DUF3267 domain-containing protein [Bacillota bacterium]MBR3034323.1 DUF3267 domain-containing protein [Bacillota bacterium]MBR6970260.1 DUF3267 domain-containing protein [Bacillota bacterium]